jgi:UDP-4-amino-4,6-dideoxy-N-acetyl-beta-L-altrosamine N-acetyltransferase
MMTSKKFNNRELEEKVQFKCYTTLTLDQKLIVLAYRNQFSIRKNMHDSTIINEEAHLKWIETLKKDRSKQYYAVIVDSEVIGSAYIKNKDSKNKASWGFFLGEKPMRAMGSVMLYQFIEKVIRNQSIKMITAEILVDNKRSIQLHKRFGFVDSINNGTESNEIKMELSMNRWITTYQAYVKNYIENALSIY